MTRRRRRSGGDWPWVTNAANPSQVKEASKAERRARDLELQDLRTVLGDPRGRRVLWRLLQWCGVHESVYPVGADAPELAIAHNAGRQDVGHFLEAEIVEADDEALFVMMREAKDLATQQAEELEAARTPSAAARDEDAPNQED